MALMVPVASQTNRCFDPATRLCCGRRGAALVPAQSQKGPSVPPSLRAAATSRRVRALALSGALVTAAAAPATAAVLHAGRYQGTTSQGQVATVQVSAGKIKRFTIVWNAACTKNLSLTRLETYSTGLTVTKTHKWKGGGHYPAQSGNGYTEKFTVSYSGAFGKAKTVKGTFVGTVQVYKDGTGQHVFACHSGRITFRLKPAKA